MIRLVSCIAEIKQKSNKSMSALSNLKQVTPVICNSRPKDNTEPYLLILLADQELDDGREEQARYLVEAAYHIFDLTTEPPVRLRLAI